MDEKKLNRILRFIEKEGGLDTVEHELLMATLNRLYIKRLIFKESQKSFLNNFVKTDETDLKVSRID